MRTVRIKNPLKMLRIDPRLLNVLQLGFAFFVIFTAFQSCGQIQATVLSTVANSSGGSVDPHAGYYSAAIIYGVFTLFNFFAAGIVGVITAKWSMVIGGLTYALFLASFLYIRTAFLYSASAIIGLGAAMIWVGQGQYLTKNSDDETMGRNSALAWAMLQCSLPIGGIFLFCMFNSSDSGTLSDSTIFTVYLVFTIMACIGVVILALLRRPPTLVAIVSPAPIMDDASPSPTGVVQGAVVAGTPATDFKAEEGGELVRSRSYEMENEGPVRHFIQTFVTTFALLKTVPMLLLAIVFIYTGLELTFWSGVYGTCLAKTQRFGLQGNELMAIGQIFLGLGEILGGGVFGIMGKRIHTRIGRSPIILLGLIVHIVAFVLIFINIPFNAPIAISPIMDMAYIHPNEYLAIFCSFLLGFADSCWNTQVYSLLGTYYSENSAPAFALFKFFQSGATCAGFFYTPYLTLQWQLLILVITCVLGGLAFFKVNHMAQQAASRNEKAA